MAIRLSDKDFFTKHIDLGIEELMPIKSFAEKGEFEECRRIFAAYVRSQLKPEAFLPCTEEGEFITADDKLLAAADKAAGNELKSCGTSYAFGEKVDWTFNPTYNQYAEWSWQLNRHREWLTLSRAFRATGDKKYVDGFMGQFVSWTEQAVAPESPCSGYKTICWRTIECGIRQGLIWPEVLHTFYREMSDNVLTDWCKSVWEHGNRLCKDHTTGSNWLIMEMNGLVHVGIQYPWFRESEEWTALSESLLCENLELQIYPDGFQYELATGYQFVVIRNYIEPMKLYRAYGREIPQKMLDIIRNMLMCYIRIMRPDGKVPAINDGYFDEVAYVVDFCRMFYGHEDVFAWIMGEGGCEPAEKSFVFEYAGLAALRTGWNKKDSYVFFDGGPFGAHHQHEDKLSVLFYADGKAILTEGNKFAYDGSAMEKYVRSTRAHNTIRVDGKEQNRRRNHSVEQIDLYRKSDLKYKLSDSLDALYAVYEEGYGEACDVNVKHARAVYFVKNKDQLRPFLIICDRLYGEENHTYEVMWHLDAEKLSVKGKSITADNMHVTVPESGLVVELAIHYGCTYPEYQGWISDSDVQDDYRPVYNASYYLQGKDQRWVTILYPDGGEEMAPVKVSAGMDVSDTKMEILFSNGETVILDELDIWNR